MDKKKFSTFSYKLEKISPIMILVNSGAFLSISSWFCELTELIFVMIPYISSTGYPPKTQGIMGHVQVANTKLSGFCFDYILLSNSITSYFKYETTLSDLPGIEAGAPPILLKKKNTPKRQEISPPSPSPLAIR